MTGNREVNAPEKTEGNDNVKVARKVLYMYGQWLSKWKLAVFMRYCIFVH